MGKNQQTIIGNNNIQIAGDVKTEKVVYKTEVIYDKDLHITDEQAKIIKDRITKIAQEKSGSPYAYKDAYKSLYNKFGITSYKILPKEKYDEAIEWLNKQIAMNRKGLRKNDPEQWRKDMYKSIHTRANELSIEIHSFATSVLQSKKPITSLTELSDTRLKKLYEKLFSI